MLELTGDGLRFSFPEVHEHARLEVTFQRTLRIPDDGTDYPLPPGLGRFPLRHVDDHADRLPPAWKERGGVMLPMYQAEAMWLNFLSPGGHWGSHPRYPMAVKVAAGKINAVSGEQWRERLHRDPQDYLAIPDQPWLDGYSVGEDTVRQFVAMPLGEGYTAEEQITGEAEWGGLQILVYPIKREVYERILERWESEERELITGVDALMAAPAMESAEMGLAPGGSMRQKIYEDPHDLEDWDLEAGVRCFVHIANSLTWMEITGEPVPTKPPTPERYNQAGLPWFDLYDADREAVAGSDVLDGLTSVAQKKKEQGQELVDNESVEPKLIRILEAEQGPAGRDKSVDAED